MKFDELNVGDIVEYWDANGDNGGHMVVEDRNGELWLNAKNTKTIYSHGRVSFPLKEAHANQSKLVGNIKNNPELLL